MWKFQKTDVRLLDQIMQILKRVIPLFQLPGIWWSVSYKMFYIFYLVTWPIPTDSKKMYFQSCMYVYYITNCNSAHKLTKFYKSREERLIVFDFYSFVGCSPTRSCCQPPASSSWWQRERVNRGTDLRAARCRHEWARSGLITIFVLIIYFSSFFFFFHLPVCCLHYNPVGPRSFVRHRNAVGGHLVGPVDRRRRSAWLDVASACDCGALVSDFRRAAAKEEQPRRRRCSGCVVLWCLGRCAQRPEAGPRMTSRGSCKSWTRSADGELCCGRVSWVSGERFFQSLRKRSVTRETVAWQFRFFEARVPPKILTNVKSILKGMCA